MIQNACGHKHCCLQRKPRTTQLFEQTVECIQLLFAIKAFY